tara:strand:+ start:825 stop:1202 length:378 start_codon:yes stop_codon:yes gene_type:complete
MLPNLKSIMLLLALTKAGLNILLSGQPEDYIASIRKLHASERFEVRYGRRDYVTEKARSEERDEEHLKAEAALELKLMPDAFLQKRKECRPSDGRIGAAQTGIERYLGYCGGRRGPNVIGTMRRE